MKNRILIMLVLGFGLSFSAYSQMNKFHFSRQDSATYASLLRQAEEYKQGNYFKQESDCYNKIASLWWEHNYFGNAVDYYNKSLEINNRLANENAIAMINSNLALIYADMQQYEKALEFFQKTLTIRKIRKEPEGIIAVHINISVVLNNLKRFKESEKHLKEALDLAREQNDLVQMRSCYGMLSETYEKEGNTKESMYYFGLYRDFNELVEGKKMEKAYKYAKEQELKRNLAEKENQIKELELIKKEYELITTEKKLKRTEDEKLSLLDTISEKDLTIRLVEDQKKLEEAKNKEITLRNRNLLLLILLIGALLFILIFIYLQKQKSNKILKYKNAQISQKNEEIQVQKDSIEKLYEETAEAHSSIKKSIDYAGLIQSSMLDKGYYLSDIFPKSFILYKPKDIVGGDFYWYAKLEDKAVVAAVDCTGHGVPGAFLTVLGNNLLNQIVTVEKTTDPSKILEKMNKAIKQTLNQDSSKNKDGMDIALCTIDAKKQKIYFAGANNPLVLCVNGKLNIIKGERYGIGGFADLLYERFRETKNKDRAMYKNNEISYEKGTKIYLFSDGYQDQSGGETGKKMGSKQFYELLKESAPFSAEKQKQKLIASSIEWRGDYEQIDDIVILGIEL